VSEEALMEKRVEGAPDEDLPAPSLEEGDARDRTPAPPAVPVAESAGFPPSAGSFPGVKKAAVLILALDEDLASSLLRCLSDAELEHITAEIANLGVVEKETVSSVLREFLKLEELHRVARKGGLQAVVHLLERSFPQDRAKRMLHLLASQRQHHPFSFLEGVEVETLVAFLEEEHPQTLAIILAQMSPAKAAVILEKLPGAQRREVLGRIASLEGTNLEALQSIEMSLRQHLGTTCFEPLRESAGVKLAAEILRAAEGGGTSILEDLKEGQPELAEEIGKHLLVFEDLAMFDDRALQVLLKEVDTQRLALALKNAPDALQARLLDNLSRRAAEMVREEMDLLGPVRFVDVEAARRSILETVLLLESSGRLYISGRGREENRIVY
jgi:flagellar motor switch protein FliG